jgi:hypothetical protein
LERIQNTLLQIQNIEKNWQFMQPAL